MLGPLFRRLVASLALGLASLALLSAPPRVEAQAPAAEPAEQSASQPGEATPAASADGASATSAPASATTGPRAPLPIMVVTLTSGRVALPDELVAAVRSALVEQLTPMTGGRPVLPLLAEPLRDAIAACAEPSCVGGQIAQAGAFGAVIARLSRPSARGPFRLTLELVDPVSGAPRLSPLEAELASASVAPEALRPLTAQLEGVMFSPPPPPPTLLVTVNVDGARVRVDDQELGESPVARVTLEPGRHVVVVMRAGYASTRRTVELEGGQSERLDITLAADTFGGDTVATGVASSRETPITEEPLFWVAIGGGALVVIGIAVGVGFAVAGSGPPPNPSGIPLPPID